jgi:hypothetical protein
MHRIAQIRTVHHTMNNHNSAGYTALTGVEPPIDDQRLRESLDLFPGYGSVVDAIAPNSNGMPTFVSYPYQISDGSTTPGQRASFLGKQHDPLFFAMTRIRKTSSCLSSVCPQMLRWAVYRIAVSFRN